SASRARRSASRARRSASEHDSSAVATRGSRSAAFDRASATRLLARYVVNTAARTATMATTTAATTPALIPATASGWQPRRGRLLGGDVDGPPGPQQPGAAA